MTSNSPEKMEEKPNFTVDDIVAYYKYCKQDFNPRITYKLPIDEIRTVSYYKKYKKYFDKMYEISLKYKINYSTYINYCIYEIRIMHPKELLSIENLKKYANYIAIQEQYKKIYKYYLKSVNYIANQCIINGLETSADYIKYLMVSNRMAEEFICGNISKYYLATIHNFDKIYEKLDGLNQDELRIILEVKDELNKDVQDAFLLLKKCRVSPIRFTDMVIKNKKQKNKLSK